MQIKVNANKDNHKMRYLVIKELLTLPEHLSSIPRF